MTVWGIDLDLLFFLLLGSGVLGFMLSLLGMSVWACVGICSSLTKLGAPYSHGDTKRTSTQGTTHVVWLMPFHPFQQPKAYFLTQNHISISIFTIFFGLGVGTSRRRLREVKQRPGMNSL